MFKSDAVEFNGQLSQFQYISDMESEVTKAFCVSCGSPIFGKNSRTPDYLTLTLGSMNDTDRLAVEVVIFQRDKPNWDSLGPDAVCFATQPDWTPDS